MEKVVQEEKMVVQGVIELVEIMVAVGEAKVYLVLEQAPVPFVSYGVQAEHSRQH
jgi:hypothetical protein